ncbi:MAG: TIGR00153 family protein [Verrucomicrobia bacterium RIFCSPHIGHO2_12_FULL_41_10]|nr:MAG: TIGR00153 family protein [Verrucomicrobia bacterium RIFCSPHIGHO2_12_FULL_41_10]
MMVSPFLKMFGKSPFRPLFEHMDTSFQCAKQLPAFFMATLKEDWVEAEKIQMHINALEEKADEIKRDLRLNLPKDLFLPVARTDLLELISKQDFLANETKHIAGLVMARKMVLPETLREEYLDFLQCCLDAASHAHQAIRELNDLYAAGFCGKEADIMEEMIEQLHHIEKTTDEKHLTLRANMVKHETEYSPIDAIFFYKVIEWTGRLADCAQKIGDRLQICIAR